MKKLKALTRLISRLSRTPITSPVCLYAVNSKTNLEKSVRKTDYDSTNTYSSLDIPHANNVSVSASYSEAHYGTHLKIIKRNGRGKVAISGQYTNATDIDLYY